MRTETLILENLIYNENYSSIVGIFLKPDYFKENAEKQVFIEIKTCFTNSPHTLVFDTESLENVPRGSG